MIWLATFAVFLLVVAGMAVGVMMGRKPIAGSCGGIANLGIEKECSICGGDMTKCEESNQDVSAKANTPAQSYDATKV
ncbi:(Na+)-NQR maturation NqrM [Atopomonas sediminilitoris]|uniref:(Na+)-NQR maturation NqrM n=1 Tax=Atopomonas sediminilitoris TaxID=2919919 RepID=UPI001F4E28FF|nr:(Na+)-NQR maturation NqrM [Atopomonas sediminilitoris]MCJ8167712.1 (Na+)-NQR maturation NqrM [Atopomonas sediminilitoris]